MVSGVDSVRNRKLLDCDRKLAPICHEPGCRIHGQRISYMERDSANQHFMLQRKAGQHQGHRIHKNVFSTIKKPTVFKNVFTGNGMLPWEMRNSIITKASFTQ